MFFIIVIIYFACFFIFAKKNHSVYSVGRIRTQRLERLSKERLSKAEIFVFQKSDFCHAISMDNNSASGF